MFPGLIVAAVILAAVTFVIAFLIRFPIPNDPPPPGSPPGLATCLFAIAFAIVWTLATIVADVHFVLGMVRHVRASGYVAVEGEVTHVGRVVEHDLDGVSSNVEITYRYRIDGREFVGTRVRYYAFWDDSWTKRFVKRHPVGARVSVYADPRDPGESVLLRDVDGGPLAMAMFLMPFNLVAVGVWFSIKNLRRQSAGQPMPLKIVEANGRTRICLGSLSPVGAACLALLAAALFVAPAVVVCAGSDVSIATMIASWLVVLGGAAFAARFTSRRHAAGSCDLVVDERDGILTLPTTPKRRDSIEVSFDDVRSVDVEARTDSEGNVVHAVIVRHGPDEGSDEIFEDSNRLDAETLASWIRVRLAAKGFNGR